ncbi:hypothetical protein C8J56DRAFT_1041358 [Mycena floridula]|nr:hypothetical protein C8J56DRAFT_1041358 [Mycena floridula]
MTAINESKPLPPLSSFTGGSGFNLSSESPLPPPPELGNHDTETSAFKRPPQLENIPSFGSLDAGLGLPVTPTTPATPTTPLSANSDGKPRKLNPLNDLIDTEKSYVDQLTGIIRKVAAAWSRSNLPPPDLDSMFRSVESVYKANRSLLAKLKDIGTNPSSPKALGDLLMRWIDDLEVPYTTYCSKYCSGFDEWEPVQSNPKLAQVLSTFSATNPPPIAASSSSGGPLWTLDSLFLLPKLRLKYYKKLYSRLLKSTAPGRSDHRLLVGALDKLDNLLNTLDQRGRIQVGSIPEPPVVDVVETEDEVVIDMASQRDSGSRPNANVRVSDADPSPSSASSSTRDSSQSGGERLSRDTASTSIRGSSTTMSSPVSDLERRLSAHRTLDIFTMTPKAVRLQMLPPSLTYTRELRFSLDVVVHLTPRSTGVEVVHRRGHIFLLSDLFLVCERMTPEERSQHGPDGPDMWLCYPPLAGKVLRVTEVPGQDNVLQVAIMRKETLILHAESAKVRNFMLTEFKECIEFASSVGPVSKQPPPPMPHLNPNGLPRQPTLDPSHNQPHSSSSPPQSRLPSPGGSMRSHELASSPVQRAASVQLPELSGYPGQAPQNPGQIIRNVSLPSHLANDPNFRQGPPPASFHPPHPNQFLPPHPGSFGQSPSGPPSFSRPNSESIHPNGRSASAPRSYHSQYEQPLPPGPFYGANDFRSSSQSNLHAPQPRNLMPSEFNPRAVSTALDFAAPSPPQSPVEETPIPTGPVTSTISAQMKCKVFLKQHHAQWKNLGSAKLKLYRQDPTNIKQLVVEAENRDKSVLISTIVLTDGVERVGKTGVAIELSDKGARTGIIYMIQLRNENSAGGLFDSLLVGSDRAGRGQ